MARSLLIAILSFEAFCASSFGDAAEIHRPSRVQVDAGSHGFIDATENRFTPIGVTYFRPGTGWAPQVWKQFNVEATRRDFALLKQHGGNVVRVFVSFGSFWTDPNQLDPKGLAELDQLLDLADEAGLYVHPTGPDGWEGMPQWTSGLGMIEPDGDPRGLEALERFWRLFAGRYRGRSTIWAYDLRNEPVVSWDSPGLRTRWDAWRASHQQSAVAIPDRAAPPSLVLLDFQHFREHIADEWVARQSDAIHAVDPNALVSVGLIQWSVPAQRLGLAQYSGFRPASIAKHLDFMELHYYPLVGVSPYKNDEAEAANLSVLEAMAREAAKPGLPLVISEFGYAGGGQFNGVVCTEAQQAQWCRRLVETTAPLACGWLNWGMYDHPQSTDVTVLTGLFTSEGKPKAWGESFSVLAAGLRQQPPRYQPPDRPDLAWDRCIIDPGAMEQFRKDYLVAFSVSRTKG